MSDALSVVALVVVPLALGYGLLAPGTRIGTCWWFGGITCAALVVVAAGLALPQAVPLAAIAAAGALVLPRLVRRGRSAAVPGASTVAYAIVMTLLMLPLAAAVVLRTLDDPALGADAIVIWYAKAKALHAWVPFSARPFPNYPDLGPAAWMLTLKLAGPEAENVGRLALVLPYFFWFLAFLELFGRPAPWSSVIVLPALAPLFFDFERFTRGDQDGLVMMTAGMAAIFMVKVLMAVPGQRRRQDAFLGAFFAGVLGLIKLEGAVLGLVLVATWLVVSLARERPAAWPAIARALALPAGLYAGVAMLWPALLLLHRIDPIKVQGEAFTTSSVVSAFAHLDRLPVIAPYFVKFFGTQRRVLLASIVLSVVVAFVLPKARAALSFLWSVQILHAFFITIVFLATRQQLAWHLETAFHRLALQGRFAPVTILVVTAVLLGAWLREQYRRAGNEGRPERPRSDVRRLH